MARIDENQEAIASIRLDVDAADEEFKAQLEEEDPKEEKRAAKEAPTIQVHWQLGSPEKRTTTKRVEEAYASEPAFRGFQKNLFAYLKVAFPDEKIDGTPLKVCKLLTSPRNIS